MCLLGLQFAMLAFEDMAKLARPRAVTEALADEAIADLLMALARTGQPLHLIRVLNALVADVRPLPMEALQAITVEGLSFVSAWVPAALQSARTQQHVPGVHQDHVCLTGLSTDGWLRPLRSGRDAAWALALGCLAESRLPVSRSAVDADVGAGSQNSHPECEDCIC